jgi:hypothetical protein
VFYLNENQKAELQKWLKKNADEILRDRLSIHEAAIRATKAVGWRVSKQNLEDTCILLSFSGFKSKAETPKDGTISTAHPIPSMNGKSASTAVLNAAAAAPPSSGRAAILAALADEKDAKKDPEEPDPVMALAAEVIAAKATIKAKQGRVEEHRKFVAEAQAEMKREEEELAGMLRDQERKKLLLRESLEV